MSIVNTVIFSIFLVSYCFTNKTKTYFMLFSKSYKPKPSYYEILKQDFTLMEKMYLVL